MEKDYIEINRSLWNKRTPYHFDSKFYDVPGFLAGKNSLHEIEIALLGDLKGKRILHLQCHFGQDTLSLARLGAEVTGVDLSEVAIQKARDLAEEMGLEARFIASDIFELEQHLQEHFDLVFTSYGVIGWLPDLLPWGELIAQYLSPGGQFILAEFHPMVWMFGEDLKKLDYSYFNKQLFIENTSGSYAGSEVAVHQEAYNWNHALADVITAILQAGLTLEDFQEYDYSPYDIFGESTVVPGGFQMKGRENILPYIFSVKATKPMVAGG
jgi:2-polyprenyl-3-methyl-5-hydroxy-6-metoxy-1,4-benzoquinol methylase